MEGQPVYYDPYDGTQVDELGNAVEGGTSFNDAYAGMFKITKGNFSGGPGSGINQFIGQVGPFQFTALKGNRYQLVSEIQVDQVNMPIQAPNMRVVSGNIEAQVGNQTVTLPIEPIPIAKAGYQWVAIPQEGGGFSFDTRLDPFYNNSEVAEAVGPGAKLADPLSSVYAAVFHQILTDSKDIIDDFIKERGIDKGNYSTTESNAVAIIMREGDVTGLRVFTQTFFQV